jgi:ferredoxin-NADP reductase
MFDKFKNYYMKLKLLKIIQEAEGTKSFIWQPEKEISFKPGQFYYYTLPELKFNDVRGATRHFTISSSPTEKDLMLTTRIRQESGYKKSLDLLEPGSEIEGEGPSGSFMLEEEKIKSSPQVLIAGGIGITPFRSFIKYSIDKNLKIPYRLIYSNSDNDFVFKKELDIWSDNYDLKTEYINTSKKGRLNRENILEILKKWGLSDTNPAIWLVGPSAFINSVEDAVEELDVSDNVRSEKFTGY